MVSVTLLAWFVGGNRSFIRQAREQMRVANILETPLQWHFAMDQDRSAALNLWEEYDVPPPPTYYTPAN